MSKLRRFLSLIPALMLWLMLSVLVWGFVFTRITDTDPAHKISLFIDSEVTDATGLAVQLEEHLDGNISIVKVHPFTYAMLDGGQLEASDLFIIRADHMETYGEWLTPLPEDMRGVYPEYNLDGVPFGVKAYDAESKKGITTEYINYLPLSEPEEDYYLCFGQKGVHLASLDNAVDNAAVDAVKVLLNLD